MVALLSLPFFRHARAFPGHYLPNQFMDLFALANGRQIYTVESNQGLPSGRRRDFSLPAVLSVTH